MSSPILHVAPFLWSGAGRVIARLCADQRRRHEVVLVTTGTADGLADWPAYRRQTAAAGVVHRRIDVFHRDPERYWRAAEQLTTLIHELKPRVIHAHAGIPTGLAAIARARSGSRARLVGQMYSWGAGRPSWMDTQDVWGLRQAEVIVCSAHAYRELLSAHGVPRAQMSYLPWGLDLRALPYRGTVARPAAVPVIGFVGRIEPRKNQVALVEAFAQLHRARPEVVLHLVGPVADEGYAAELASAIDRLHLRDAVHLAGHVADVARVVRRWSLFVSLSSDEGQGLAVLEAMALGVPVAARRVAGIADFLAAGRTGWALDRPGAAATARVLQAALGDPRNATIVRRARTMVERRYDWATMEARFDRLYRA